MQYSVIIPTHNEGAELLETVESAFDSTECCTQHSSGLEVIVVDDQCTDGSIEALMDALDDDAPVTVLNGDQRLGCAGAKRLGAAQARGDMLVFVDSHCRFGDRWLHHLEDGVDAMGGPEAGLFGPAMGSLDRPHLVEYGMYWPTPLMLRSHLRPIQPGPDGVRPNRSALFVSGNGQAISRELYYSIGGFDDGLLPPWGAEDEELCLRLWRYGYEVTILPQWQMLHMFKRHGFQYEVKYRTQLFNTMRCAALHLDHDRYRKVLYSRMQSISEKTSGPEWQGQPDVNRYRDLMEVMLEIHRRYTAIQKRAMEHSARATRSIDEIFERCGMNW